MKLCRECNAEFKPTSRQRRKHDFLCGDCRRAYDATRRQSQRQIRPDDKCAVCRGKAVIYVSYTKLCAMHYRLQHMRESAKAAGKTVPSRARLRDLALAVLNSGTLCPCCGCKMGWLREESGRAVITLQHDHSGEFRLICLTCNKRHASYPNDSFYTLPDGHKRCYKCATVKPFAEFNKNARGWHGLGQRCRACDAVANAKRKKVANGVS